MRRKGIYVRSDGQGLQSRRRTIPRNGGEIDRRHNAEEFSNEGEFIASNIKWWCSGFYPGTLWYIYEYSGDPQFKSLARKNTLKLDTLKTMKGTDHDLGFQMNCSYGNAYRITGDKEYLEPILTSAKTLAKRFSPVTGVIRSWDFVRKGRDWKYPVIIDNMMNLEHLCNAGSIFNDDSLKVVAVTHANTTMCNHFRPDYTSWHLVDYDPESGEVRKRRPSRVSAMTRPGREGRPGHCTDSR